MIVDGGDLDAGDSLTHWAASGDVVKHRGAVGADEIPAQALPDNVWGETVSDPVGIAAAERIDPAEEDQLEVLGGLGHGRVIARSFEGLVSNAADLKRREWPAFVQAVGKLGRLVQEHRGELIADRFGAGAAVGQQRGRGAVEAGRDRSEQDVLGAGAVVPEPLRERLRKLEQSLGLRRDTEAAVLPRRGAPEPFNNLRSDFAGGDAELGERAAGELVGLCKQAEDEVLGTQVMMAVLARRCRRREEHRRSRPLEPGWQFPGRRWGERDVALLGGLFGDAERASDLSPTGVGLAGSVDVVVEQLIGARTQRVRKSAGCCKPVERARVRRDGRVDRGDQGVE
jgi:hypothetical protein